MNAIGRVVMSFLDGQADLSRSPAKQGAFLPEWTDIGRMLGDRIAREERTPDPLVQGGRRARHSSEAVPSAS